MDLSFLRDLASNRLCKRQSRSYQPFSEKEFCAGGLVIVRKGLNSAKILSKFPGNPIESNIRALSSSKLKDSRRADVCSWVCSDQGSLLTQIDKGGLCRAGWVSLLLTGCRRVNTVGIWSLSVLGRTLKECIKGKSDREDSI